MSDLGSSDEKTPSRKKKTLKDSFKTPLCSRDNSLRLKCSREKGLIYFYDIKEAKLNYSLCS